MSFKWSKTKLLITGLVKLDDLLFMYCFLFWWSPKQSSTCSHLMMKTIVYFFLLFKAWVFVEKKNQKSSIRLSLRNKLSFNYFRHFYIEHFRQSKHTCKYIYITKRHQHRSNAWDIVWRINSWCDYYCCRNVLYIQKSKFSNQKNVRLLIKVF